MTHSRSPSPVFSDPGLKDAMDAPSSPAYEPPPCGQPATTPGKRKATSDNPGASDNEDNDLELSDETGSSAVQSSPLVASNSSTTPSLKQLGRHLAKRSKLRPDQLQEVDSFAMAATKAERDVQLLVHILSVKNMLEKIVVEQPKFEVTKYLDDNIKRIALGVLLSTNIASYTGPDTMTPVEEHLKRDRFGMPPNIERNTADWKKVIQKIQYHQMQIRAHFKRLIEASVEDKDPAQHDTVFVLTKAMAAGACDITIGLCARVALMRHVYMNGKPDKDFWPKVNERLASMRKSAKGNKKKGMVHYLTKDCEAHGIMSADEDCDNVVQTKFQQEIDDALEN
ncbi:hypothetical protein CERSUDRAFT_95788 [Gelatoporia subvermispora B]|uniref:Uncharacterized protein n=1 Tax=Ceriporiopsis subvermispora (strain B) TaxID=914234 RepID=M2QHI6_CERS8|nr:hypothetical protein CERSUDRAFT_95788 [Gelatoporia subvermispora B]